MTAHVNHKTRNPPPKKFSNPKVGFGEILKIGRKVGPEVGLNVSFDRCPFSLQKRFMNFNGKSKTETYFPDLFLTCFAKFENSPVTYL